MPLTIGSTIASMGAQRQLSLSTGTLASTFDRLSSGLRINRASDDAAGLAIADSLNLDAKVFNQAVKNANDFMSALSIAGSALDQLTGIIIRQKELAEQAANGTFSTAQRRSIQKEADALTREYSRIVATTSFNGLGVLNGGFLNATAQLGFGVSATLSVAAGSELDGSAGNNTLNNVQTISSWEGSPPAVTGDFNNDGRDDFITAQSVIRLANQDGTFQAPIALAPVGGFTNYVVLGVADFDGDGNLDFIRSDPYNAPSRFAIYHGNGDGTFRTPFTFGGAGNISDVAFGDINGDGMIDFVGRRAGLSEIHVFINQGNGTFGAAATVISGFQSGYLNLEDYNQDGLADISFMDNNTGTVHVGLGSSSGSFSSLVSYAGLFGAAGNSGTVSADFNRDGFLDMYVTSGNLSRLFLGNGDGSFSAGSMDSILGSGNASLFDYNQDGLQDLVAVTSTHLFLRLGNADGSFSAITSVSTGTTSNILSLGDFNGDGVVDLLAGTFGGASQILISGTQSQYNAPFLSLHTAEDARESMDLLDRVFQRLIKEQGAIGAYESRLRVAANVLDVSRENFRSAESIIRDADIATESANLIKTKILQQSASSVLAQINLSSQRVLDLLAGPNV